ncbi:MAG: ATP-dependent helicase [Calditrichae bacterium]|nr:ATP-dependent helicase [Calditrichia bacterium]
MKLTDQQLAIIQHLEGPALVFAVAGAGKTTCMVHRIRNMIAQQLCQPQQILATSFNNSAVADIVGQLQRLNVPTGSNGVDCRTLHSLGFRVIRGAVQRGFLDKNWLRNTGEDNLTGMLIGKTLTQMAIADSTDITELDVDREDLKNQISIWKGNLAYADLEAAGLPEAARHIASAATHENGQYLRAYKIFEHLRTQQFIITFDDMLMMGWELLIRHPEILQSAQDNYRSIIVDEFQDVNFAQYQLLDLLSAPHRNYMAIGDDDQCIYEWRGANPSFILNFEKNYGAKVYTISDNFRSCAQQILPANAVIAHNKRRYPKFLSLTRGFGGSTQILAQKDEWEIAKHIAGEIADRIAAGQSTREMAVLIRLYSQTAHLEAAFMEKNIPYEIVGAPEFYKRDELLPLFQYLSFAFAEAEIAESGFPEDPKQIKKYHEMFANIVNKPRRYISRDIVDGAQRMSRQTRRSVIDVLKHQKEVLPKRVQQQVDDFCETIRLLLLRLKRPAHKTLGWLVEQIEYESHLIRISGQMEIGQSRVQTVKALIEFAKMKNLRCGEFLAHLREITIQPIPNPGNLPPVKMLTIYKSKGLEWQTVFVPGSSEGTAPFVVSEDKSDEVAKIAHVEAERRLFYVAMTRAKANLFLYYSAEKNISPFLDEAKTPSLLTQIDKLAKEVAAAPDFRRESEQIEFIERLGQLRLDRFFTRWSNALHPLRNHWHSDFQRWQTHIRDAEAAEAAYREALTQYQSDHEKVERQVRKFEKNIRESGILIHKFKSAYYPVKIGQTIQFEVMDDGGVIAVSGSGMVGMVDFDEMPRFDRAAVIWERSAVIIGRILSDTQVEARFSTLAFDNTHLQSKVSGWRKPSPPKDALRRFLNPNFRRGLITIFGK